MVGESNVLHGPGSTILALMLASAGYASPAWAQVPSAEKGEVDPSTVQTPAAASVSDEGEIIVTARRVSESLQETPATITVFTPQVITNAGIRTATDFVEFTPGVTIVANSAEAGDNQINIRGINSARDAESGVALVVDGILKTNTAVLNQDQGTVRQIEVLKGPQGAIYGRNAAAGAIVITTLRPGDVATGGVRVSAGNNDSYNGAAYFAAPLGTALGVLLSGDYLTTDGFYRNRFLNGRAVVDDREAWNLNGRLVAEMSTQTTVDGKLRYGEVDGASIAFNPVFALPNFAVLNPAFYEDVNEHRFIFDSNIRPENHQETFEASLKVDHNFGRVLLSAWALYSDVENFLTADGTSADFARYSIPAATNPTANAVRDACFASTAALTGYPINPPGVIGEIPIPILFAPNGSLFTAYSPSTCDGTQYQQRDQRDVSVEVRLASADDSAALQWQLGGYYLNIDRQVAVSLGGDLGQGVLKQPYGPPGSINPTSQLYWDNFKTDVYALFGALDLDVTSELTLSAALRFDREKRRADNLVPAVFDPITGGSLNPGQLVVNGVVQSLPSQKRSFEQLQPKLSVTYSPIPELAAFANWGIGFKSGGFNNQGSSALVNQNFNIPGIDAGLTINDQFRKERSSAFEGGVKGSLLDGSANYEIVGYYTRVSDMQFFEFLVGSFGLLRVVSNIDRVDIKGIETNLNVRPVAGWSIFGSLNVTDSEIKRNRSRPDTVGNKSPYTADFTINVGTQFVQPIGAETDLILRADWRRTGPTWFHTVQNQERPTVFSALVPLVGLPAALGTARYDINRRDTFDIVNLRLGLERGGWRVTAFANNVFKERNIEEVIPAAEFGGSFVSPGPRRAYGIEAALRF
jgi:iron complex outermembrane receptor protein